LQKFKEAANDGLEFAKFTLQVFKDIVLKNDSYVKMITSDTYTHNTYYMGLVDENNKVNFYDGKVRVIDPSGKEFIKFAPQQYLDHIAEQVEPWSYVKFPYLKKLVGKGLSTDLRAASIPLHRLLVSTLLMAWQQQRHRKHAMSSIRL